MLNLSNTLHFVLMGIIRNGLQFFKFTKFEKNTSFRSIYIIYFDFLPISNLAGVAIKCFVCNSHKDANCALDIPPDNLLKDCQEEYSSRGNGIPKYCRKITQVIEFSVNSRKY